MNGGGGDNLKAGNLEGEKGEIRKAQTVFPVALIKGGGGGEGDESSLLRGCSVCVANPLLRAQTNALMRHSVDLSRAY